MDKYKNNCNCNPGVVTSSEYNSATSCGQEPTQLRTVVIPATQGGDAEHDPYAPKLGMWRNTVVVYEKNNAVYLYDVNGVYTNLTGTDWGTQIATVATESANAMAVANQTANGLQVYEVEANGKLLKLTNDLVAAQAALTAEATARTEADNALSDQLSGLSTQVQQLGTSVGAQGTKLDEAITDLQTNINAEANARTESVEELQTNINANTNAIANLEATVGAEAGGFTKELVLDLTAQPGSDTVTLTKTTGNLSTTATEQTDITLPVASENQAGILSAEDYAQFSAGSGGGGIDRTVATGWEESSFLSTDTGYQISLATYDPTLGQAGTNAEIPFATQANAGVMSPADKTKLDGLASGITGTYIKYETGNNYTVPTTRMEAITITETFPPGNDKYRKQSTISFKTPFTAPPVMVAQVINSDLNTDVPALDAPRASIVLVDVTTTGFTYKYGQPQGASEQDLIINFIAFGH